MIGRTLAGAVALSSLTDAQRARADEPPAGGSAPTDVSHDPPGGTPPWGSSWVRPPDDLSGAFIDLEGNPRWFGTTYDAWFSPERRRARYARAFAEASTLVTLGLLYYWVDPLANSEDWDDPPLLDRFTGSSLRFDTNLNTTNHFLHPGAGALIYGAARINGLEVPEAFLTTFASSVIWELALEWREKPSLNDIVFTSVGGVSFGEFAVNLGDYLNSAPRGGKLPQKIAASTLGFPRRIHAAIDRERPPDERMPPDNLGFSSAYGHDFRVGYDLARIENDIGDHGLLHRARIDALIVAMPGFLRPGRFATSFESGNFSDLRLKLGWGDHGLEEVDMRTRATIVGRYAQDIVPGKDGRPRGVATLLGAGTGLRFHASDLLGRSDQLSTVHLVGPHAAAWFVTGDLRVNLFGELYADFAAIRSLAYPSWVASLDGASEEGAKSVLQRQGYQYSTGAFGRAGGSLQYGPIELSASVGHGRYGSIEGLDRFQEQLTHDVHGTERLTEIDSSATLRLSIVTLGVGWAERSRRSQLGSIVASRWDREARIALGLAF